MRVMLRKLLRLLGRFACFMDCWHSATDLEPTGYDNCRARCRRCKRKLLWSSGGWFAKPKGGG